MKPGFLLLLVAALWLSPASGRADFSQMSPEEHASHHAAPSAPSTASGGTQAISTVPKMTSMPADGGQPAAAEPGGGMGAGMGDMMKEMGKPPRKELYPSLMALPDHVTPEEQSEIEQLAQERMKTGTAMLSSGLEKLSDSTSDQDFAAMQLATERMREGIAWFEGGVAAKRVFSEGNAPRNLAMDWFKREMNLASSAQLRESEGVTPFHFFVMVLLVAFALAMVTMYFFKMRRAAALFGRLEPDKPPPSPGAPPPPMDPPKPIPPPTKSPVPPAPPVSPAALPAIPTGASEASSQPPVTANWKGRLRIGSIVTETPSLKTFRLLPSSNEHFLPFTFMPGQFLNIVFWIGGAKMNRSYSIASSPLQREYLELAIRREPRGAVSRHIDDLLKLDDEIEVGGPVGKFTFTGAEADSIVLISAGVGITPMMSITRYLTELKWAGEIFFIYTCRTPADFIFADESAALQRVNPKLHVAVTISKPEGTDWTGPRGRITREWLTQTVPDLASRRTHLCGPPSMMDSIRAIFNELGIPSDHLKTEAFGTPKRAPAASGTTAKPSAPATGPLITFSKNNKSAKIHTDVQNGDSPPLQTILELSEELGIGIEFSCRVGTCGICKVKITSGEVDMAVQDALEPADKSNGIILACQAKPRGEVTVEA